MIDLIINTVCGLFLPAVLFICGSYFIIRLGRYALSPAKMFRTLISAGKHEKKAHREKNKDETLPFTSMCMALAGTLGVGNITGVASAIMLGGAGCVFWMWVCAAVSAVLKFAETLLAVRYRVRSTDGKYHGGAYYYIRNGLKAPGVAAFFSVICVISSFFTGNMAQVRSACDGIRLCADIPTVLIASVFMAAVLYITLSGSSTVARFTTFAVPILCTLYVIMSVAVIFIKRDALADVTGIIFREAFSAKAGVCGVAGFLSSGAIRYGICRGIMSNEAGCGTAPIAHAGADNTSGLKQGYMGVLEVFCDTLLLCSLTAYAVLLSGVTRVGPSAGVAIGAFETVLGKGARFFLGAAMFLFALASVAGWSHYGKESLLTLGGGRRTADLYSLIFSLSAFAGCLIPEGIIWKLSDLTISVMAMINVPALLILEKECRSEISI